MLGWSAHLFSSSKDRHSWVRKKEIRATHGNASKCFQETEVKVPLISWQPPWPKSHRFLRLRNGETAGDALLPNQHSTLSHSLRIHVWHVGSIRFHMKETRHGFTHSRRLSKSVSLLAVLEACSLTWLHSSWHMPSVYPQVGLHVGVSAAAPITAFLFYSNCAPLRHFNYRKGVIANSTTAFE